jgi:FkbM family methyltransferase
MDYWVIVDTGSTDGTQKIIKDFLKDIPGELHERPWVNFGHNRQEALELAKNKADYIFFIDADDCLVLEKDFKRPLLDKDFYYIYLEYSTITYKKPLLINAKLDWKWKGVLHELLILSKNTKKSFETLKNIKIKVYREGAASKDPKKYLKHIQIFKEALKKEPNNSRYRFYLAQSYKDARKYLLAIKNYKKRISMGGWSQEIFWSMLQIAKMQQCLKMPEEKFLKSYYDAYLYMPNRIEPLYYIATHCRKNKNYFSGYIISKLGVNTQSHNDVLFVEDWIYKYGLLLEYSLCAYYLKKYEEAKKASLKILNTKRLRENIYKRVEKNLEFINTKISLKNASNSPRFYMHPIFKKFYKENFKELHSKDPTCFHHYFDAFEKWLKNPIIFEAGGHNGEDTIRFSKKFPKGKIISFEPHPVAFKKLLQITSNSSNVSAYNLALNEKNGIATFYVSHGKHGKNPRCDGASSLLEPIDAMKIRYVGPKIKVPCVILDDWCIKNSIDHIDFMWLDIEGLELQVLKSSPKILKTVKIIYIETSFFEFRKGATQFKDLKNFLTKASFKLLIHWYKPGFQGDAIFVKNNIFEEIKNKCRS